jgi:hypothetical protein
MNRMSKTVPSSYVVPKPSIPKTIGLLNILLGFALAVVGVGYVALYVMAPSLYQMGEDSANTQIQREKAERAARISELTKAKESAETKEEREQASVELETLKSTPEPRRANLGPRLGFEMRNDKNLAFAYTETIGGVILNIAMIVSGFGLLILNEWARRLALWVAGIKIARIVVVTVFTLTVIIPYSTDRIKAAIMETSGPFADEAARIAAERKTAQIAEVMAISSTTKAYALLIFGSIYPIVVLVCLTRRAAWAACIASKIPPRSGSRPPDPGPLRAPAGR